MLHNKTATFSSLSFRRLCLGGIFALLITFALQAQTIRYVKATATGTGDGASWANASADLQAMINASGSGSQVWVAAGTYTPTRDAYGNATPSNPRSKTFYVKDGVKIYGGFLGTETLLSQRVLPSSGGAGVGSILSGDMGTGGSTYHVVLASANPYFGGSGVTVDGFKITGGNDDFVGSSITVNGNQIFNGSGSAISLNYGVNTISNNTVTGNYSRDFGGAIFTNYGTNTITNNTFSGNGADGSIKGTGVFWQTSIGGGGAIFTYYGSNTISNNTFSENGVSNNGGAIHTYYGSNSISSNTFSENSSYNNGGAIHLYEGSNGLYNNTLHHNRAYNNGGAIDVQNNVYANNGGTATINNNTIYDNSATNSGGAVATNKIYVTFASNVVYNNYATNGGGFFTSGRLVTWQNNTIANNTAYYGGAVYIEYDSGHSFTNNTIANNTAYNRGGGIYNNFSNLNFTNNIFWGNKKYGSTSVEGADYDNENYRWGSNIYTGVGAYVYGKSVFKNNLLQLPSNLYLPNNATESIYNTLEAGSGGNIFNQDPKFVLPEVPSGFDGQFRTVDDGLALQAGSSPCINAGTWSAAPSYDIRGVARVGVPDIGAYENAFTCVTPTLYMLTTGTGTYCAGTTGLAVGLSGSEIGVTYQLKNTSNDLVGSPINGTGAAINFGTYRNGTYSVLAIRTNGGCRATMSGSGAVTATACCPSGTTIYVNAAVTGGTYDGNTWANAYTNLSEALFAAHNCSAVKTIKVAAGTYTPTMKPFNNGVEIATTDARDFTFHVPDGVTIEGGYDASTGNRPFASPPSGGVGGGLVGGGTILSGDIGKLDDSNDNAYHVVLSSANSATGVGITIDGFTIKAGNANGSSDITVNANTVARNSGAAIVANYGVNTISNNSISGNSAQYSGGGVAISGGTNTISNNSISGNSSSNYGGGVYIAGGMNTISNNSISGNNANRGGGSAGGGIYVSNATNTISNNIISGNYGDGGGGIFTSFGTNTINNNTISGNSAIGGGGVYIAGGTNTITANAIIFNYASHDYEWSYVTHGGGIYAAEGTNTFSNNIFYGNGVYSYDNYSSGGGLYASSGTNTLTNNTFTRNNASTGTYDYDPAGGAIAVPGGSLSLINNIFWGNTLDGYTDNVNLSSANSTNNSIQEPLFVDINNPAGADGKFGTNDDGLRLQESSGMINAGTTSGAPSTDISGASRLDIPDIGAYENVYSCTTISVYNVTGAGAYCAGATPSVAVGLSNSQLGVSYQLIEGINTKVGSPINGTGAAISFGNQIGGRYTVLATKIDNSCKASMRGSATITSFACCPGGNTLYVNASASGGDGSTWANAYSSLSDALFAAHSCSLVKTIKVAAGTYKPTRKPISNGIELTLQLSDRFKTFHIPDGVTLEGGYDAATGNRLPSFGGAGGGSILSGDIDNNDIIDANGAISSGNTNNTIRVVLASGSTGVSIDGFSITGGYNNSDYFMSINGDYIDVMKGGGIYVKNDGTNTIKNNTLYNNYAGRYGAGIYIEGGIVTITNNTLYNNNAYDYGGGIYVQFSSISTITNNTLYNNSGGQGGGGIFIISVSSANVINNTLYNNSASYGGGIYVSSANSTLTNNTLYNNSATNEGGGICTYIHSAYPFAFTPSITNTLTNNIFWANKKGSSATVAGADFFNYTSGYIFKNNLLQLASSNYPATGSYGIGSSASGNLFNQNPLFVSTTDFVGADAKHRTIDDGLRLQSTSPCVNKGIATNAPTTDITGANRVGLPDIGAYEYFIPCTPPSAFTVTGGGALCTGDDGGAAIGLSNSVTGVTYQLKKDGTTNVGTALSGTGAALNFGNQLSAGTYTVLATTTSSGCTATMTGAATISINAIPNITINVGNTCGKSVLTVTPPLGAGGTYLWSNGATTAKNTVTVGGSYSVTATGTGGCAAITSAIAAPTALPTVTVTVTNNCGNSLLVATGTPAPPLGVGGITYEWTKTIKTASTTVTQAGTHNVYVTDATTGCKGTASAIAAPKATVNAFILGNNNCGNSVLTVIAPTLGAGGTGGSYLWSNGATTADITVTSAGAYTATVSSAEGCTAVTSTEVTPKVIPTASISVTDNCGNSVLSASATPALGVGGTYLWSNGETTSDITLIATGVGGAATYTVTLTNSEDCSTTVSSTATLKIDPTIYMVTGGGTYCAGLDGLEVGLSGSQTGVSYQLQKDNANVGTAITGTGAAISFGKQMGAGTYSVIGTHIISACMNTMLSPKTIAIDETLPAFVTASVPTNLTINCSDAIPSAATPSATNSCSTVSMSETSTKGTDATQCSFYSYAITRTWTATDKRSNTATVSQVITVQDKTAPTIATLANVTVTEAMLASVTSATATDCSPRTATFTDVKVSVTPPACYTYRTNITRTWLVSDACGNTATKSQFIVSQGLILTCPANKTFNTNSDGTANYNCSTVIKASDNVSPAFLDNCNTSILKYTLSGATAGSGNGTIAGLTLNKGVTTVTYGLQAAQIDACFFTVTVNDSEAPKFGTVSNSVIDACNIPDPITMTAPSATDNCSGVISVTPSMDVTANVSGCASKAAMLKYTKSVTRTWIAADVAGNTSTAVQRMYIRDMQAPTAICKDITVYIGSSNISVLASQINNGSSDNCTATAALSYAICRNIGIVCTYASGLSLTPSMIPTGSNFANIPVTLRVTDACGNIGTCTATIRLQRVTSLTNGNTNNSNTNLSTTSDSAAETTSSEAATPSTIDATHGSLKCFPNPFSDNLNLEYNLAKAVTKVTLKVYDNQGRLVTSSEQGEQLEGFYQVNWNLSDLQSGMYHVCLEIDGKCTKVERVIRMQ